MIRAGKTGFGYAAPPGFSAGVRISGFIRQIMQNCRRALLIKQMIMGQLCWSHAVSVVCLGRTTVMQASVPEPLWPNNRDAKGTVIA